MSKSNQQVMSSSQSLPRANGKFKPGIAYNKSGTTGTTPQQRYIRKLQTALDRAIDGLGEMMGTDGATAIAVKITESLDKDCVGTLAKLTPFIPKNINVDVQVNKEAHQLSDADLEAIIAHRQAKEAKNNAIEGEIVDDSDEVVKD